MADTYVTRSKQADSEPAIRAIAINFGGGDQDLSALNVCGLYITTAGTLKVDTAGGDTLTFAVITGILPLKVTKIYQSGSASVVGVVLI